MDLPFEDQFLRFKIIIGHLQPILLVGFRSFQFFNLFILLHENIDQFFNVDILIELHLFHFVLKLIKFIRFGLLKAFEDLHAFLVAFEFIFQFSDQLLILLG